VEHCPQGASRGAHVKLQVPIAHPQEGVRWTDGESVAQGTFKTTDRNWTVVSEQLLFVAMGLKSFPLPAGHWVEKGQGLD
jgi:hypothetical protein